MEWIYIYTQLIHFAAQQKLTQNCKAIILQLIKEWDSEEIQTPPEEMAYIYFGSGGSVVKIHLPLQEMWVQSLVQEDPLEKEMTTHFSILSWEILWAEEPRGLYSMGSQRFGHNLVTKHTHMHIGLE